MGCGFPSWLILICPQEQVANLSADIHTMYSTERECMASNSYAGSVSGLERSHTKTSCNRKIELLFLVPLLKYNSRLKFSHVFAGNRQEIGSPFTIPSNNFNPAIAKDIAQIGYIIGHRVPNHDTTFLVPYSQLISECLIKI